MELTKDESEELKENISKLKKKYKSITNLLEQIDSEMHELFVINEDLDYLIAQNQSLTSKEKEEKENAKL